jgi:hypothetical protein
MVGSDPVNKKSIADALRNTELTDTDVWNELIILSDRTTIGAIEVFEDEIKIRDSSFEGLFNVHCQLLYGNGDDAFTLSETFPGRFEGQITERDGVKFSKITVDTSGFRS